MKALIYRYNSICEPDIIATMQEFGIEVVEYTREMTVKDDTLSKSVDLLSHFLMDNPVDFVFSINFFPYVSDVCNIFKLRYICWTVDSPVMELFSTSIKNEWNRVFIFDKAQYEDVYAFNPDCIFYLPLAARTQPKEELFKKTSEDEKMKFRHDVAFVGSLYTEKCPYDKLPANAPLSLRGYLDGIMRSQELVYGYYFIEDLLNDEVIEEFKKWHPSFYTQNPEATFLTDKITLSQLYIGNKISAMERVDTFKKLSEHFPTTIYTASDTSYMPKLNNLGTCKSLTEMPIVFNQSKINLNITSKAIRTGLPLRIFDILSCGGFIMTNFQAELPELFTLGEDLVAYSSLEELLQLTEYYLTHDAERIAIAENGYETLKNNYTYEIQLQKLLYKAFER